MSSPVLPVPNESLLLAALPSLFGEYDRLELDAIELDRAEQAVVEATLRISKLEQDLASATKNVECNISQQEEQTNRIRLVTSHWFFGTSALQPQLWLRGGCLGKASRAQSKLQVAVAEAPELLHAKETLKLHLLPHAQADFMERKGYRHRCRTANDRRVRIEQDADLMPIAPNGYLFGTFMRKQHACAPSTPTSENMPRDGCCVVPSGQEPCRARPNKTAPVPTSREDVGKRKSTACYCCCLCSKQ